jgi:hypothetical protein
LENTRNNSENNMSQHVGFYLKSAARYCLTVILFSLYLAGCVKIGPTEQTGASLASGESSTEVTQKSVYNINETAEQDNVRATLLSVTMSGGNDYWKPKNGYVYLICEFEIENGGQEEISVSSILSFCTYIDGEKRDLSLMAGVAYGEGTVDGTILPGETLRGAVGYEVPENWKKLEIHFTPDMMSKNAMVFSAKNSGAKG